MFTMHCTIHLSVRIETNRSERHAASGLPCAHPLELAPQIPQAAKGSKADTAEHLHARPEVSLRYTFFMHVQALGQPLAASFRDPKWKAPTIYKATSVNELHIGIGLLN